MKYVFSPGCSLSDSKPYLVEKIHIYLNESIGNVNLYSSCCRSGELIPEGTVVINACPGCDEKFSSMSDIITVTLWEMILERGDFPFPKHEDLTLTVHDSCPIRKKPHILEAVRKILGQMDIKIVEAKLNRENSVCCGYSYKGELTDEEVNKKMKERADSLPLDKICVYCMGCLNAMTIGGGQPKHLLEILLNEV